MQLKRIYVTTNGTIPLGRQGENMVRQIVFPQPAELMQAEWTLSAQRSRDSTPYPVALSKTDGEVVWDVTSADTAMRGIGKAQLMAIGASGEILLSRVYMTDVQASLDVAGEPPDPVKPWYDNIIERLDQGGGGSGTPSEDGGYYTPTISQADTGTMIVAFTASDTDMPTVEPVTVTLPAGPQGDRGSQGIQGEQGETGPRGETGPKGDTGERGPQGADGKDGAQGPKGDKGDTGATGPTGATGAKGADGYTPVRGVDYWTEADQESIVQQIITALGTPVFGTVDADKVITLSGALAEGTYTIRYEDADGKYTTIGTLDNREVSYINQLAIATDEKGEIWNGTGYLNGYRLQSYNGTTGESSIAATEGYFVTGFIPYTLDQVKAQTPFYIKGVDLDLTSLPQYLRIAMTLPGCTDWIGVQTITDMSDQSQATITKLGDKYYKFTPNKSLYSFNGWNKLPPTHARFSMPGSGAGVIITVNEPIE